MEKRNIGREVNGFGFRQRVISSSGGVAAARNNDWNLRQI
jgi:hypothetical protein